MNGDTFIFINSVLSTVSKFKRKHQIYQLEIRLLLAGCAALDFFTCRQVCQMNEFSSVVLTDLTKKAQLLVNKGLLIDPGTNITPDTLLGLTGKGSDLANEFILSLEVMKNSQEKYINTGYFSINGVLN